MMDDQGRQYLCVLPKIAIAESMGRAEAKIGEFPVD
jgi:hypothetical protein